MKKLSYKHKFWLERIRLKRYIKRKKIPHNKLSQYKKQHIVTVQNKFGSWKVWVDNKRKMPEVFCLEENYEETANIIKVIRNELFNNFSHKIDKKYEDNYQPKKIKAYYDFTRIKKCSASAALVLAAEYDRVKSYVNWSIPIFDLNKWDKKVKSTLSSIGFFRLLEIEVPEQTEATTNNYDIIDFRSGSVVGREAANEVIEALTAIIESSPNAGKKPVEDDTSMMQMFGALVEATENTCFHAYEGVTDASAVKKWWMTGAIDKNNHRLILAVYDQGLTIPATLPQWKRYGLIKGGIRGLAERLNISNDDAPQMDHHKLNLAMEIPISSTGCDNRGKGFPCFKEVIDNCKRGSLRIISRHAEFVYKKGEQPQSTYHPTPLFGTLVEWDITI